ncbi:sialate O-acetylesterase [Cohnella soli]|uniref:Sialate O-acetylesterase n=1 Tax=Cohnella soli TaxID=425005 RepID=A0ABW0HVW9_9BACL
METVLPKTFVLNAIFSDNMVLQRGKNIKVWGKGADGDAITVALGHAQMTVSPVDGVWTAVLPPMEAVESCEMSVSSAATGERLVIRNVAIGEVWIAGGQSNMEYVLRLDAEAAHSVSSANNPSIRFFDTPKLCYEGQEKDGDFSDYGFWRTCDPDNAGYYSAIGYYFALKINESLNVPVGIVGCNWGGTTASTWLGEQYLERDEDLSIYLREYEEATRDLDLVEYERQFQELQASMQGPEHREYMDWLVGHEFTEQPVEYTAESDPSVKDLIGPKFFNRPARLFHAMVKQIAGYTARGVLWYQGESDAVKPNLYGKLFTALIACWRAEWQDELPFLSVQLAPFRAWFSSKGVNYPIVREQQELVSKTVPLVYMASVMDGGMIWDIHPKNKRPVGERLALLARGKVYGQDVLCEASETSEIMRVGASVSIAFLHAGAGLVVNGDQLNGLQLFIDGEETTDFEVDVRGNALRIDSEAIEKARSLEIRFAWTDYVEVNLYSSAGLPAKPFRFDL